MLRQWLVAIVLTAIIAGIVLKYLLPSSCTRSEEVIKIGILFSLTGPMAVTEKPITDALLMAIEEFNEKGGLLGKKIVPIIADGKSDWALFGKEAERLIKEEQVTAIFGCVTSASRKVVKEVVEKYHNVLFYPGQYEGLEQSPNIIYLGAASNQQAIPAVVWSMQNLGKRFFLVGTDYIYPHAVNQIMKYTIASFQGELAGEEYFSGTPENADEIIKKIIATQPTVIINTIIGEHNSHFFKALRKAHISAEKVPTVSLTVTETELREFNIEEMIGDYAVQNYFQSLNTPPNKIFVTKFKNKFGVDQVISNHMENAYSGFHFYAEAVIRTGTTDSLTIIRNILGRAMSTPEGIISIDEVNHHSWKPVLVGKIFPSKQFGIIWNSVSTIAPVPYPIFRSKEEWEQFLQSLYARWGNKWWKD